MLFHGLISLTHSSEQLHEVSSTKLSFRSYRWGHQSSGRTSDLPKITPRVSNRAQIWNQAAGCGTCVLIEISTAARKDRRHLSAWNWQQARGDAFPGRLILVQRKWHLNRGKEPHMSTGGQASPCRIWEKAEAGQCIITPAAKEI